MLAALRAARSRGRAAGQGPQGTGGCQLVAAGGGVYQSSPGSYCFWRGVFPPLAISSVAKTKENGATLGFSFYSLATTLLRDANPSIPFLLWSGCCRDYVGAPAAARGGTTLPPWSIGRAELVWASQIRSPRRNPPQTHAQAAEHPRFQAPVTSSLLTCQPAWPLPHPRPQPFPHCRWTWLLATHPIQASDPAPP